MKKTIIFLFLLSNSFLLYAQGVAINVDKSAANPSAMLDVKSSSKGLLIPRTSTTSRLAIVNPAKGLMLYDTTAGSFWFYNGSSWNSLSTGTGGSYWSTNGADIYNTNAANVGIGTNASANKFQIGSVGATGFATNDFAIGNGTHAMAILQSNSSTTIGATTDIILKPRNNNAGYVGINVNTPVNKLQIGSVANSGFAGNDLAIGNGVNAMGIFQSNTTLIGSTTDIVLRPRNNYAGYVGINIDNPVNKLQIGSIGNSLYAGNDIAIGNGVNAMGIYQSNRTLIGSTTDIVLRPRNSTGYVGINVDNPINKLQVGSLGNVGFAGNDIAIGNGVNAAAIYQSNANVTIGSTTDIVLRPRNNGLGRVGINTTTPGYPLDVSNSVFTPSICYAYFARNGPCEENIGGNIGSFPVSIYASSRVLASEFDAFSDVRIKDIVGVSIASDDLKIINALQITDYTMKDKVKYGNQTFKKVIAQEVEKVYPQVVSKHTDFIPNVYQLTNKTAKSTDGFLLSFTTKHNISKKAKKLQVLLDEKGLQQFDIISIPSENEVLIAATDIKSDSVFVYGEEVDDFRTVDYEGLTTLNISATQELSKLVEAQNKKIEALEQEIKKLVKAKVTLAQTKSFKKQSRLNKNIKQ